MIIIATGNYRTGSTLAFNLAREICNNYEKNREIVQYGFSPEEIQEVIDQNDENRLYLLKSHEYLPDKDYANVKCVHTTRCMLDAFASSVIKRN